MVGSLCTVLSNLRRVQSIVAVSRNSLAHFPYTETRSHIQYSSSPSTIMSFTLKIMLNLISLPNSDTKRIEADFEVKNGSLSSLRGKIKRAPTPSFPGGTY